MRSAAGTPVPNAPQIGVREADVAIAQINHYFVKSKEEWARKVARGYGWPADDRTGLFERYDRNECEDRTILARRAATEGWMERLRPSPTAALARRLAALRRRLSR